MPSLRNLWFFLVLCACFPRASAVCYLEDTSSDCSVCWVTTYSGPDDSVGVTKMAACPGNIVAAYDTAVPNELYADREYPVTFSLQIDPQEVQVSQQELKDGSTAGVPHANIHSCIASRGACTPFVANTPGLSTHTPASTGDFDTSGKATFEGLVKLDVDVYIIIAHIRFYMPSSDPNGKATKYDVAVGVQREVLQPENEISADAYIMAGIVGFMIIMFGGIIFYMVKKGILDLDRIMALFFSDYVTIPFDIVCGMGDAAAFTISCTIVLGDPNLLSVVPICWLFCGIAWGVSIHNMIHDMSYLKMMYDEHYNSDNYQKLMMLRMSKKWVHRRKSVSQDLNHAGKKRMARRLSNEMENIAEDSEVHRKAIFAFDVADRDFARRKRTIASILLESLPITTLQTYILVVGDQATGGVVAVLALLLAALLLGCKLQGLGDYGHAKTRRELALKQFDELFSNTLREEAMNGVKRAMSPEALSDTAETPAAELPDPVLFRPTSAQPTGTPAQIEVSGTRAHGKPEETAVVVMDADASFKADAAAAQAAGINFGWTQQARSGSRPASGAQRDVEMGRTQLPGSASEAP